MPSPRQLPRCPRGRTVGTIKTIDGSKITLTTDAGTTVTISLQDSTRLLRIEPGEKDLKNAVKIIQQDLQPGDRILAAGEASPDGHTIVAASVIGHEARRTLYRSNRAISRTGSVVVWVVW